MAIRGQKNEVLRRRESVILRKRKVGDSSDCSTVVQRIQGGIEVEENFQLLFRRCGRLLWFFFERRGVSTNMREDLVQETMLKVFRSIHEFRSEAHFDTWLFEIARNVAREHVRRLRTVKRSAKVLSLDELSSSGGRDKADALAGSGPSPLDIALEQEQATAFDRAVSELPKQMRQCAILRYRSDLKYTEIASILGISLSSVRVQLWRTRRRLRSSIAGRLGVSNSGREPLGWKRLDALDHSVD